MSTTQSPSPPVGHVLRQVMKPPREGPDGAWTLRLFGVRGAVPIEAVTPLEWHFGPEGEVTP